VFPPPAISPETILLPGSRASRGLPRLASSERERSESRARVGEEKGKMEKANEKLEDDEVFPVILHF
jgi:hypothetical protein